MEKKKDDKELVKCVSCKEYKMKSDFYNIFVDMKNTETIPFCKECLRLIVVKQDGTSSKEEMIKILKRINKPFFTDLWKSVTNPNTKTSFGRYLRALNVNKYRTMHWSDGEIDDEGKLKPKPERIRTVELSKIIPLDAEQEQNERYGSYVPSPEDINLFGSGFSKEEYFRMREKYEFLKDSYSTQTNMHKEALVTYIRFKVKEEMALVQNKIQDAKAWSEMAKNASDRAKLNPSQLSKADLQGGLSTISEIALAIEQYGDIIPHLPKMEYKPNDSADFIIWEYVNYVRSLQGKPLVEYKDIYKFYDERKKEYIDQTGDPNGIFKNDTTEENRQNIENFIDIPKDGV